MFKAIILIPARYESSRFPGKPLATINGLSLIQRVYQNMKKTNFDVAVVTDNQKIEDHVMSFGGNVVRIDDYVSSGTERIHLAYKKYFEGKFNYDLIINVQGDEPLLMFEDLVKLAEFHFHNNYSIATLVKEREGVLDDFRNPNIVKVIFDKTNSNCLYFSRAGVPYPRDLLKHKWYQHIGVYSYKPEALDEFCKTQIAFYEDIEKLEQLRALNIGLRIGGVLTQSELIGVDTPEDILKVEGVLSETR